MSSSPKVVATPPSTGIELDKASGETLKTAGGSAHVDVPISLLTRGDYVLVVQMQTTPWLPAV